MKKVLFCATVDYHFKAFHLPVLKWFKEQGWEVHIAASGQIELPYVDKKYEVQIQRSPFNNKNIGAYKKLKGIIDNNSYSMIHCHTPMGGVLTRLAARNSRKRGTKVLYTAHGFHFCKGAPVINWLIYYPIEKMLARYTDCLLTINQEDYQLAKKRFKTKNITHVHGVGVNTEKFKPLNEKQKHELKISYGYHPGDFLLFYAAEFNKNKNQRLLIHALAQIKNQLANVKLLLAGEGILQEQCKELAENLGVAHMVDFLGYRNDIDKLVSMCDVAVASSLREGLPVNMMEAMACGLPVIATSNRGHNELINHVNCGWIIDQDDSKRMAEKIDFLIQHRESIEYLGLNARYNIESQYSVNKVMKELSSIYATYMLEDGNETKSKYNRAYI